MVNKNVVNKKGKFIVIEGIDGSGKGTQVELLIEKLKSEKIDYVCDDYPRYGVSFWGDHVGKMLTGEFGKLFTISPYLAVLPYMLDEADGSTKTIRPALEAGKIVVSNRYFTSNVHQIAKQPKRKRAEYSDWLWSAGYNQMGIARPDIVIVLLVGPSICRENVYKKAERTYAKVQVLDQAEENFHHQMESAKEYQLMSEKEPKTWKVIDCCKNGKLLPKEEIAELIWKMLRKNKIL